jgi:hypothetical protein
MTLDELRARVAPWRYWVQASASPRGPQAAVVGVAVGEGLELVFDTLGATRKAQNLRADPRIALVGWEGEQTLQVEGLADEPAGDERTRILALYLGAFPDGRERVAWPGITWVRVRPTWLRWSDYEGRPPEIFTWAREGERLVQVETG